jgi:hypothetical protein
MKRLSQKAYSRSPRFYKRTLLFFSVLCFRICGAALSNYLDAIGLRLVQHHSTHSIRRHICLHAWPFHGFLVGRQSLALSKKDNKTICTSILSCWPKSLLVYPVSQMCHLESICFGTLSFDDIHPNNLAAKKTPHNFRCSMIKSRND